MQRRILISGGPVHAYIDAVKLVTNRFRGGRMTRLALDFAEGFDCHVTYLCAKGSLQPVNLENLTVIEHDGFDEYRNLVCELSKTHTDVILGAAVANLIPANPWKGKFPSHDYQTGDIVKIDFLVAPRIIEDVKKVAPHVNLFGFKLLSGVTQDELVRAAYGIVLEAKAMAVIANDTNNLNEKFIVTKERGVHPVANDDLATYLWLMMNDEYYRSEVADQATDTTDAQSFRATVMEETQKRPGMFTEVESGLKFGTVATRAQKGFWTTPRGKKELDGAVHVMMVDHIKRVVHTVGDKATLNAPLLDTIFSTLPQVHTIVHAHEQNEALPVLPYAPPGSVRDTMRNVTGSFNIEEHGCFLLFDANGQQL